MATGNFYKINLDNYYILDSNDEYVLEDTKGNIYYDLKSSIDKKSYQDYQMVGIDRTSPNSLNSFYRHNFIEVYFTYKQMDVSIYINFNSGYYENGNFDIDISINGDNVDLNNSGYDDVINSLKFQKVLTLIEKTIKRYTVSLRRTATFSNGETIYEKNK